MFSQHTILGIIFAKVSIHPCNLLSTHFKFQSNSQYINKGKTHLLHQSKWLQESTWPVLVMWSYTCTFLHFLLWNILNITRPSICSKLGTPKLCLLWTDGGNLINLVKSAKGQIIGLKINKKLSSEYLITEILFTNTLFVDDSRHTEYRFAVLLISFGTPNVRTVFVKMCASYIEFSYIMDILMKCS